MRNRRGIRSLLRAFDRRTVAGIALAAAAAAIVLVVTRPAAGVDVVIAAEDLAPGAPLTASALGVRAVDEPGGLVLADDLETPSDWMLSVPLASGEPIVPSLLVPAAVRDHPNLLAVAVEQAHAVLGRIAAGDRIDVFVTWPPTGAEPATTERIGTAIFVVEAREGVSSFGGGETVELLLAVDDETAPQLAAALQRGMLDLVRRAP